MAYGYNGRILRIDLSEGAISIDMVVYRSRWQHVVDCLALCNLMVFCLGAFSHLGLQCPCRESVLTKTSSSKPRRCFIL